MTASVVVATACGGGGAALNAAAQPAIQHADMSVAGTSRTYRLFVPATVPSNRPAPLVIVLHAALDTADQTAQITGFDDVASAHGAIAVYPQGIDRTWNGGICCGTAMHTHVDDVTFITALIDRLEHTNRVDPARVYIVGVSNGAILAYTLACSLSTRIAAIASVAGTMSVGTCHPSAPVSVLEIHGTDDQLVPYQGGPLYPEPEETIPSAPAVAAWWANFDGCPAVAAQRVQAPVTTETWAHCGRATAVSLITVQGGTHVWYASGLGPADGAMDATQSIATFLFQHPRSAG